MSTIPGVILQIPDGSITNNDIAGNASISPSKLGQKVLAEFVVPAEAFKTWDAVASNLPASAASDDLGLVTGTWLTNPVRITAGDCKNLGATTRRAYFSIPIPDNYDDGETIHFLRTEKGAVLNGSWKTTKNNKWLTAYKTLKPATQPRPAPVIRSYAGKAFSAGRIKSNPDLDITEDQYEKIMNDYRVSLGW